MGPYDQPPDGRLVGVGPYMNIQLIDIGVGSYMDVHLAIIH